MHVVGTEVQYSAVRVHVPGTYYIIHTLKQQTATAAVVVLHTVASFVSCCLLYAIYGSIDCGVLLPLDRKLNTVLEAVVRCWGLL